MLVFAVDQLQLYNCIKFLFRLPNPKSSAVVSGTHVLTTTNRFVHNVSCFIEGYQRTRLSKSFLC